VDENGERVYVGRHEEACARDDETNMVVALTVGGDAACRSADVDYGSTPPRHARSSMIS
jgi:hypothetical protein